MTIRIICPNCNAALGLNKTGQTVRKLKCQRCSYKFYFSEETGAVGEDSDTVRSLPSESSDEHESSTRTRLLGSTLGGCRIEEKIGQGGMGAVFRGLHLGLDRPVAIKVLPPSFARSSKKHVERFIREARAAARLQHRNMIGVHDVGVERGLHYIIMEYVDGPDLHERLKEEGCIPETEALEIIAQVADALDVARQGNMVHRDVKPHNIMLDRSGTAKLMDLGLAKSTEEDHGVTRDGTAMGTPHYIAPEQAIDAAHADHRSDIYSLGCTLFHMICGRVPYKGTSMYQLMKRHENDPVPDPRSDAPDLSDATAGVIMKMMAKKPEDRYQTGAEIAADARAILAGKPVKVTAAKRDEKAKPTPAVQGVAEAIPISESERVRKRTREAKAAKPRRMPLIIAVIVIAGLIVALLIVAPWATSRTGPETHPGTQPPASSQPSAPSTSPTWAPLIRRAKTAWDENRFSAAVRHYDDALAAMGRDKGIDAAILDSAKRDRALVKFLADRNALTPSMQFSATQGKLREFNPRYNNGGTFQERENRIVRVDVRGTGLKDLRPLKGLQLIELVCAENEIGDLSPLRGMPLERLDCSSNPIRDLTPLTRLPLKALNIGDTQVENLILLQRLRLTHLNCSHNPIRDLSPLRGMPLQVLACGDNHISSLDPIKGMRLRELHCEGNAIRSLRPLTGMRLHKLSIQDTDVSDLSPLNGMPLTEVRFSYGEIRRGMEVLRRCKTLSSIAEGEGEALPAKDFWAKMEPAKTPPKTDTKSMSEVRAQLHAAIKKANPSYTGTGRFTLRRGVVYQVGLAKTGVKDLAPLKGLKLSYLALDDCAITDLSPLKGMPLATLSLNGCPIADLRPLAGMPLHSLYMNQCAKLADLRPLRGVPLRTLTLDSCDRIKDLSPLAKSPLRSLDLRGCAGITDVGPLRGLQLRELYLHGCTNLKSVAPLAGLPLRRLTLADCSKVTDLSPLKDVPLNEFVFTPATVKKGIKQLRQCKTMRLIGTQWPRGYAPATFWKMYDQGKFKR